MTLLDCARVAQIAATVLAVVLRRHVRGHAPVTVFLVATTALAALHALLKSWVVLPEVIALGGSETTAGAPLLGWERVAAHVDQAAVLAWSAAVAMVAMKVFYVPSLPRDLAELHPMVQAAIQSGAHRNRRIVLMAQAGGVACMWTALVAFFAATYPEIRHLQPQGYLLSGLLSVFAGWWVFVRWVQGSTEKLTTTQQCVFVVLLLEPLQVVAAHLVPGFFPRAAEDPRAAVRVLMFGAMVIVQGGGLWRRR